MAAEIEEISDRPEKASAEMRREDLYVDLMELIREVADYVIPDGSPAKERIGEAIMGRTLKLRSETLLQEGMEKGLANGMVKGREVGIIEMLYFGDITSAVASKRLGKPEDEISRMLADYAKSVEK